MRTGSEPIRVGTAGWSIPRAQAVRFAGEGLHLERYAAVFGCAEINSTFYRPHRPATYRRWAEAVGDGFEFAVKVRRTITHEGGLRAAPEVMGAFLGEVGVLGDRLGPLLFQLPPKQVFDGVLAREFFDGLREICPDGRAAVEARHASWFVAEAEELLREYRVARVAADPAVVPAAGVAGGWPGLVYYRLHGSPRVYYSGYEAEFLDRLAVTLREEAREAEVWCVFDNTASGAAAENALYVHGAV